MDKTSNVQYSANLTTPVSQNYTLNYTNDSQRLRLVAPDSTTIFDVALNEIEYMARPPRGGGMVYIKLKNGNKHYLHMTMSDLSEWTSIAKGHGVRTTFKLSTAFNWVFGVFALFLLLVIVLSKI